MSTTPVQDAFIAALDGHRGILLNVARAYCRDEASREDLVQEIAVQLWRGYPRYNGRASLSTWIYRIAINVAISFYRAQTRRPESAGRAEQIFEQAASAEPVADEQLERLQTMIEALEPLDRALMLLYLDDRPYAEIAEILGISESNVGTKINRIKTRLKRDAAERG